MFDRSLLKANAKKSLSRNYGMSLVAFLIYYGIIYVAIMAIMLIVTMGFGIFAATGDTALQQTLSNPNATDADIYNSVLSTQLITYGVSFILALIVNFFGGSQLAVGHNRFYLNARENPNNLGDLFAAFKKGSYWKTAWTMLTMSIYIYLWCLLFLIPGYIKMFEYSMIPYLLAENPNMSRKRAFELSKAMTKGYKGDLFILGLSFMGWIMLSFAIAIFTCGIGAISVFFLYPYIFATFAEAYTFLKARAIENGIATTEDFPGFSAALPTAPAAEAPAITE